MSTSVTASTSLPDCPRPSRLRRFSLRTYTQNQASLPSGQHSYRHSLSSRIPWFSNPGSISPTASSPAPCPESDHPILSRYTSAPAPSYGFGTELNSQVSSTDSAASTPSNDPIQTPNSMARLRSTSAAHRPPPRTLERATDNSQESTPSPEPGAVQGNATEPTSAPADGQGTPSKSETKATIRFFPYQDALQSSRPSLPFVPVARTLPSESCVIRVGRYSERDGVPLPNPTEPSDAPVGFKSKVVSRKHCEFLYVNGQWHIKDVGSSSGTFLNHMRLSQPNMVSRLYTIKDGDIVQLGIDFRGGEEMIFRCVRIRIECNRSWQQQPNEFNKNTESLIKNLGKGETADYSGCRECSICLGSVLRPYQCLFMAACAHVWHYKCISRLLHSPDYPMFQCPNCRAFTDLSAEVDDSNDVEEKREKEPTEDRASNDSAGRLETEAPSAIETSSMEGPLDQLGDLPEEENLVNDVENLHLVDDQQTDDTRSSASPAPNSSSDDLARSATINIPGWQPTQPLNVPSGRPSQLRSETPTSDDNPLTPRNDSGPLAFDGRAGMP
ncbi:Zinc finger, RING-type [Penicillium expansum]|uniref:Zinc finger, RING-type n=1 Tax=Penicillium expansum TaxID=27334 RepID=A0A0A2JZH9_PENEN|nr:Zinc finger, RING-type [Penicillium expansum]KGO60211.1 Zinc finger, RING-type [Penicillium expansum]KGO68737.1 Zinc finger, RING-type [Penicillium expansum]